MCLSVLSLSLLNVSAAVLVPYQRFYNLICESCSGHSWVTRCVLTLLRRAVQMCMTCLPAARQWLSPLVTVGYACDSHTITEFILTVNASALLHFHLPGLQCSQQVFLLFARCNVLQQKMFKMTWHESGLLLLKYKRAKEKIKAKITRGRINLLSLYCIAIQNKWFYIY